MSEVLTEKLKSESVDGFTRPETLENPDNIVDQLRVYVHRKKEETGSAELVVPKGFTEALMEYDRWNNPGRAAGSDSTHAESAVSGLEATANSAGENSSSAASLPGLEERPLRYSYALASLKWASPRTEKVDGEMILDVIARNRDKPTYFRRSNFQPHTLRLKVYGANILARKIMSYDSARSGFR